jgi:protoporphyrinogen oxidase
MNNHQQLQGVYQLLEKLVDNTLTILEKIYDPHLDNLDAQLAERESLIGQLRQQASFLPLWKKDERLLLLFGKVNAGTARLIEALRERIDELKQSRRQNVVARLAAQGYLGNHSAPAVGPLVKA